jgi:hypothetical protein
LFSRFNFPGKKQAKNRTFHQCGVRPETNNKKKEKRKGKKE